MSRLRKLLTAKRGVKRADVLREAGATEVTEGEGNERDMLSKSCRRHQLRRQWLLKATTPGPQILPALSWIPYLPLQTLTDAELEMTVEVWR